VAPYVVYVLQSLKDPERYYVGLCKDLEHRLTEHNAGESSYTIRYRPWKVIVSISFESLRKAEAFEKYLKSGSGRTFCQRHF